MLTFIQMYMLFWVQVFGYELQILFGYSFYFHGNKVLRC